MYTDVHKVSMYEDLYIFLVVKNDKDLQNYMLSRKWYMLMRLGALSFVECNLYVRMTRRH